MDTSNLPILATKTQIKKAEKAEVTIIKEQDTAIDILNKQGGTVEKACKVLTEMMDAEVMVLDKYGEEHRDIDHRVRHLGALTVLEIHKVIKDKTTTTSLAIFNDPNIISDAQRVLKLDDGRK